MSISHRAEEEAVGHEGKHGEKEDEEDDASEKEEEEGRGHAIQSSSSRGPSTPYCIFCGQFFPKSRDHILRAHTRAIPCLQCDLCFASYSARRNHYKGVHQCDVPAEQRDQPMIEYRKLPEVKAILDQFNGDMRAAGLAAAKEREEREEKENAGAARRARCSASSSVGPNRRRKGDTDDPGDEGESESERESDSGSESEGNSDRASTSTPAHCIVCGNRCASVHTMRRHLLRIHFPFYCISCSHGCRRLFVLESERKEHYRRVHGMTAPPLSKPYPASGIRTEDMPEVKKILDRYEGDMRAAGLAAATAKERASQEGEEVHGPTGRTRSSLRSTARRRRSRKDECEADEYDGDDSDSDNDSSSDSKSEGKAAASTSVHCIACGDPCASMPTMCRHLLRKHFKIYSICCPHPGCSRLLAMDSDLKAHYRMVHGTPAPPFSQPFPASGVQLRDIPEVKKILQRHGGDMRTAG